MAGGRWGWKTGQRWGRVGRRWGDVGGWMGDVGGWMGWRRGWWGDVGDDWGHRGWWWDVGDDGESREKCFPRLEVAFYFRSSLERSLIGLPGLVEVFVNVQSRQLGIFFEEFNLIIVLSDHRAWKAYFQMYHFFLEKSKRNMKVEKRYRREKDFYSDLYAPDTYLEFVPIRGIANVYKNVTPELRGPQKTHFESNIGKIKRASSGVLRFLFYQATSRACCYTALGKLMESPSLETL